MFPILREQTDKNEKHEVQFLKSGGSWVGSAIAFFLEKIWLRRFWGSIYLLPNKEEGVQPMQENNQPRGRWTHGSGKEKFIQMLKNRKKVVIKDTDGVALYANFKPQDHGIKDAVKAALIKRHFIADTSATLQRLGTDIYPVIKKLDTNQPKKGKGNYDRTLKIYTNPETGESGDTHYWSKKLGMRYDTFWRRLRNWGEDNPKIFQPISCKGNPQKCNKFSSDITYASTAIITKELSQKIEEAITRKEYEFATDIFKAAIDKFQLPEDDKIILINKKGQGKQFSLKLNYEQKAKVDEFIMKRKKLLESSGKKRFILQSEALVIILDEFFNLR